MGKELLTNSSFHFVVLYAAQFILAIVFTVTFEHFGRVYKRSYNTLWALSWLGFSIYNLGMGLASLNNMGLEGFPIPKVLPSLIYLPGGMLQIVFLLLGTFELVKGKPFPKGKLYAWGVIAIVLGVVMALAFAFDPTMYVARYIIRIGARSLFAALAFIVCGMLTFKSDAFGEANFGRKLLGVAFILYGMELSYYFITVVMNVSGYPNLGLFYFYGILDLLLLFNMGLAMVMWLLEYERNILKKINAQLDSFIYRTSHDLRAPIASVLGLTNLSKKEIADKTALLYMDKIQERMEHLDATIHDILDFSQSNHLEINLTKIDLAKLINEVENGLKIPQSIVVSYRSGIDHIVSDLFQIKLVLNSLLDNAIRYSDKRKEVQQITITSEKSAHNYIITVSDNGQGIEEEVLPRIFDMFYRGNQNSQGTGLGLYIVKEALSRLGGKIEVTSKLHEQTTFKIVLPQ